MVIPEAEKLSRALRSTNRTDKEGYLLTVADGLFAIADALTRLAQAVENGNKTKQQPVCNFPPRKG